MSNGDSDAGFYGLAETPFEPTGAAADKYPYVAPRKFDIIEEKINEVAKEKKLYVILFRAPQGGGKTATATELKRRIEVQQYAGGKAVLALNKLVDLDFSHYASDFVDTVLPFLPDIKPDKSDKYKKMASPGELKNVVISFLKSLASKFKLVVWVIDEFDILVDYTKQQQSQFLQILREIVDDLANEHYPILFIMSHTIKSSKEFEKHLRSVHGPFQSRIVASVEIGYTFPETKNIVAARLRSVRRVPQAHNSIEPFTDEAIRTLYDLIVATGGTGELNDFRFFERCCYQAILKGAKQKAQNIGKSLVQEIFQETYSSSAATTPQDKVSLSVRSARTSILANSQMSRNEAMLDGLHKGLELMGDQFSSIPVAKTIYGEKIEPDVHLSALQVEVEHKPTGKKILAGWVLGARDGGMVFQDDMRKIDVAIPRVIGKLGTFPNLTIFSYVSDMTLDHSNLVSTDEVIPISVDTARDLIGLGLKEATGEDIVELRKSFESEIASTVRNIFTERVRDLTRPPTEPVYRLVKALNVAHSAGVGLTRESLKEEEKKLFGGASKALDRHLSDLIELGFAREEGSGLVPAMPRALDHLMVLLNNRTMTFQDIQMEFGSNSDVILSAASRLGLASVDKEREEVKKKPGQELDKVLIPIPAMRELVQKKDASQTFVATRAQLLIKALDKVQSESGPISYIVKSAAFEVLPDIQAKLAQTQLGPGTEPEVKTTVTGPAVAQTTGVVRIEQQLQGTSPVEQLVILVLNAKGALTLEDLIKLVAEKGGTGDLRNRILGMVMKNKLKLSV